MCRPVYRLAVMLVLMAVIVAAQTNPNWNTVKALAAGTDVRISAGPRTVKGKIDRVTDDSLAVTSGKGQEMLTQQEISRVEVGKKSHRRRNSLIGLGVGAGVGLVVGVAADSGCTGFCILPNAGKIVLTPLGAIAGVLVGVLIPTGGWREIYKK